MLAIFFGLISIALGCFGIFHWMPDFLMVLKGILPLSFICGGMVAILAGISALRK